MDRSSIKLISCAILAGLVTIMAACGPVHGYSYWELRREHRALPDDVDALKQEAEARFSDRGPPEEVVASLRAGCKAVRSTTGRDAEASFLTCRACFWLLEYSAVPVCYDPEDERLVVVECSDHCREAVRGDRGNALYTYLLGAAMGLKLKGAFIHNQVLNISSLIDILERAVELDPGVDQGGPLRLLGALYLRAPPWPRGPGDSEKALGLLERAVEEYPGHPLNHFFYAEALLDDEEYADALEEIEVARACLDPDKLNWRAVKYSTMIDRLEGRIQAAIP